MERTPPQISIKMCNMEGGIRNPMVGSVTDQGILDEGGDIKDKIKNVPLPLPNTSGYEG